MLFLNFVFLPLNPTLPVIFFPFLIAAVRHVGPLMADIVQQRTSLSTDDQNSIVKFAAKVIEFPPALDKKPKKCALKFVKDDLGLAQAVAFILHLSAGLVPRNEETYKL